MKPGALSAAIGADTEHVVCFARDGSQRRWPELVLAASRVCAAVGDAAGRRWAIDLDDTFEFAAALLGIWAAGKTAVLAPRSMLESNATLTLDGVVGTQGAKIAVKVQHLAWHRLGDAPRPIRAIESTAELVLYTSGSTGAPKQVTRQLHNVEAELAVLESLWGERLGRAHIYSTVSHRHVYGLLFRVLWPLLNDRPFATFDFEYPEQLIALDRRTHALIASPALLKRIGHLPDRSADWCAVFSSGGLLSAAAARDSARVLGATPFEVLGSTETSGVAWRQQLSDGAVRWRTMAGVETRTTADWFLEVRSPFTGHTGWLQMGDMVRPAADRTFELLGRGDHLAKIEDKRISLAEIEQCLLATPWVVDAAAVALEQNARQYVGAVLVLNAAGAAELKRDGRRAFGERLRRALGEQIEPLALPRKIRCVERIPVDAQGKRRQSDLKELFGQP